MLTTEEVTARVKGILVKDFECDEAALTPEANLFTDLDLDSIDAVDLAVRLQNETGKRVPPESFRNIRTFGDVVKAVTDLLNDPSA